MKNTGLFFEALQAILSVLCAAFEGDKRAQERLRDILPGNTYIGMVRHSQDDLDEQKFGKRAK